MRGIFHLGFAAILVCIGALTLALRLPDAPSAWSASNTVKVPVDYPTLQAAIDAVSDGDTILVQSGSYAGSLSIAKTITLSGGWDSTFFMRTPGDSIVDADGAGRAISITGNTTRTLVTIDGFTITGGDATGQGGLPSAAALSGDILAARATGAGLPSSALVMAQRMTTARNTLDELVARGLLQTDSSLYRSAVAILGEVSKTWQQPSVFRLAARALRASTAELDCGGGVFAQNAGLVLLNSVITANGASEKNAGYGGGICVVGAPTASVTISGNIVRTNAASGSGTGVGGGLYVAFASGIVIQNNYFVDNLGTQTGASGLGGGIAVVNTGDAIIQDNGFLRNKANPAVNAGTGVGGGAYLNNVDRLALSGNRFSGNLAGFSPQTGSGGGLYLSDSEASRIESNIFAGNWAVIYLANRASGGGLEIANLTHGVVIGNRIEANTGNLEDAGAPSVTYGGGLSSIAAHDTLVAANLISGNVAAMKGGALGGGVWFTLSGERDTQAVDITGNTIANNTASLLAGDVPSSGGGMGLDTPQGFRIVGNRFSDNRSVASGGGSGGGLLAMHMPSEEGLAFGDVLIDSNAFVGNAAPGEQSGGGGFAITGIRYVTVTNNVLLDNHGRLGGGMGLDVGGGDQTPIAARIANNTLIGNAPSGIDVDGPSVIPALLLNNIVLSHTAGVNVGEETKAVIAYTLWGGNASDIASAGTVTHTQPVAGPADFVDPAAGDYRLRASSAARDAGDPAGAPPAPDRDADGFSRPFGPRVDIGAYEWNANPIRVPLHFPTIQQAIAAARDGYTIQVRTGEYRERLRITQGITLSGGWNDDYIDRQPGSSSINAAGAGRAISITAPTTATLVTIDGFTITGGNATGQGGLGSIDRLAILSRLAGKAQPQSAPVADCGGGIYSWNASLVLMHSEVVSNVASSGNGYGGGVCAGEAAMLVISSNTIRANTAGVAGTGNGGGVYIVGAPGAVIAANRFEGNIASLAGYGGWGGGLGLNSADFILTNNVFAGNQADYGGGAALSGSGTPGRTVTATVINNTFASNGATGLYLAAWLNEPPLTLINNIIASHTVGISMTGNVSVNLSYTLWNGNQRNMAGSAYISETHPITGPARFVNPASGNYRIHKASAARDAGDPAGVPPAPDHDADDKPRPYGLRVDIGAYEWRGYQAFVPLVEKSSSTP